MSSSFTWDSGMILADVACLLASVSWTLLSLDILNLVSVFVTLVLLT